jgi:hypothetical protein
MYTYRDRNGAVQQLGRSAARNASLDRGVAPAEEELGSNYRMTNAGFLAYCT